MKSNLSNLIESGPGGVYRSHAAVSPAALDAASKRGMRVAACALQGARDKNAFLGKLAATLRFPEYFGHNWDAFYDCLIDLAPEGTDGMLVILREASGFARAEPDEFAAAIDALRDAADYWGSEGRKLIAVVELDAPVLAPELTEVSPPWA